MLKKIIFILVVLVVVGITARYQSTGRFLGQTSDSLQLLEFAFENKQSDLQVEGKGEVIKLLADDLKGNRHQRFILELDNGQSLMIAHNIDLASRIDKLKTGDDIAFFGEYEWNKKGGMIHWTHHDPNGQHPDGWLKHQGNIYQ
jgi:molybdopterin converting factor small subunit